MLPTMTRHGNGVGDGGEPRAEQSVLRCAGFGFVETLVALALLTFAALAVGQMVVTGVYVSEASEDLTNVTALAAMQLEGLKATPYDDLTPGGSLTADVAGYFDTLDMDANGTGEFTRRWQITDLGRSMQLDVIVLGPDTATGEARQLRLTAEVADKE